MIASQFNFYRMNVNIELVRAFISCVGVFVFLLFIILAERDLWRLLLNIAEEIREFNQKSEMKNAVRGCGDKNSDLCCQMFFNYLLDE